MNSTAKSIVAACVLACAAPAAQAQTWRFDTAAYISCREAHAMTVENRRSLALFLAEHAARHHGVRMPEGQQGAHLAILVRGGCTLAPDSHLFAVIDRAITAEKATLNKRLRFPRRASRRQGSRKAGGGCRRRTPSFVFGTAH